MIIKIHECSCTGVHWFANELIKAIVLLKINQLSPRHTPVQVIKFDATDKEKNGGKDVLVYIGLQMN